MLAWKMCTLIFLLRLLRHRCCSLLKEVLAKENLWCSAVRVGFFQETNEPKYLADSVIGTGSPFAKCIWLSSSLGLSEIE